MKKSLLLFGIFCLSISAVYAQCVPNCSAYTVNPTTYSLFPTGGTNVSSSFSPNSDDGYTSLVPIGFSFNYYCTTYTSAYICSNGFIVLGSLPSIGGADPAQSFPSTTSPNGVIALNMCDLDCGAGGAVTFTTIGTTPNQRFIVTYSNVPYWYSTAPTATLTCSGQIVLFETSNMIQVHTATIGTQSYISSQGIENQSGTSGVNVPGRTQTFWSASNSAYAFTNLVQGTPPTSVGGNSVLCFGSPGNFSCISMPGASSYSWTLPGGWSGSSTTTALSATAGVGGNLSVTATYTCGTSAPAQFSVNVIPSPVISVTSVSPSVLCSGSVVSINASGGVNYTLMPGNITGTPPFTVMPMTNLTYSVYGDNSSGCISVNPGLAPVNVNATPTVVVNSGSMCLGQTFTMAPSGAVTYSYSSLFTTVTPTTSGTFSYMVWGMAGNGCVGSAVSSLTVTPLPTVLASSTRTSLCVKESVTLTAVGASSFNWIGVANTNSIVFTPSVSNASQIFTVTGTNTLGCTNSTTIALKVNSCTGLNEISASDTPLSIFPNPFTSVFHITSEKDMNAVISVYSLSGALVYKQTMQGNQADIHLENAASGVYYVKVNDSPKVYKLVKSE